MYLKSGHEVRTSEDTGRADLCLRNGELGPQRAETCDNRAGGATVDEFVEWFPSVTEQQVREVLEHEAKALSN